MKILLAWKNWKSGEGRHLRRYNPEDAETFLGFQAQTPEALEWMEKNNNPIWPECLDLIGGTIGLFSQVKRNPFEEVQ